MWGCENVACSLLLLLCSFLLVRFAQTVSLVLPWFVQVASAPM